MFPTFRAPETMTAAEQASLLRATASAPRDHVLYSMALGTHADSATDGMQTHWCRTPARRGPQVPAERQMREPLRLWQGSGTGEAVARLVGARQLRRSACECRARRHVSQTTSTVGATMGEHDNYPSELSAQPGESKGQPLTRTDSRSISPPACPHRVIAGNAVRPAPGAPRIPDAGEAPVPIFFHTRTRTRRMRSWRKG